MEQRMKFSVSMCVYGGDNTDWFETAVNSVVNQTLVPDEIVLVVDGPVGKELDSVICYFEKNSLFKVIRIPENLGHGNARRIGLKNCSNELVALMDADDISVLDRFEKQVCFFENNSDVSIVGGNISEFIEDPKKPVGYRVVPQSDIEIKKYLKKRCPFNQMTVMFKKSDVDKAGGYLDWFCNEDYYLWLRMYLERLKFANLGTVLVNVRVGKEMYKRRGGKKYFISEYNLQKYMLKKKIISFDVFVINVLKRFVVQILLPSELRSFVFQKFGRKKTNEKKI